MKYSVIIPVYRSEETIKRCLDSILAQPHNDVEILVINDGSPDDSGKICKQYAAQYSYFRYFEKENGGVSSARNLGLDKAEGDYILFVDSDDYVTSDYFKTLNASLQEKQPDMLMFGYRNIGGNNHAWNAGCYETDDETEVASRISAAMQTYLFSTLMTKTFKREIIQKYQIRFNTDISIGEDQEFIFQYAIHIKHLVSVPENLYMLVLENSESLSRKRRDYLAEQLLAVSRDMLVTLKKSNHPDQIKLIYYDAVVWSHYRNVYSVCMELLKYDLNERERRIKIKKICKAYALREFRPCDIKCIAIAFPVICRFSVLIDIMVKRQYRKRQKFNNF